MGFNAPQDQYDAIIGPEDDIVLESDGQTIWVVKNEQHHESITTANAIEHWLDNGTIVEIQPEEGNIMKAKTVLHHDDPPCTARLDNGFCRECGLTPDTQSICFYFYCPSCDCPLANLKCPKCKRTFKRPD